MQLIQFLLVVFLIGYALLTKNGLLDAVQYGAIGLFQGLILFFSLVTPAVLLLRLIFNH